MTINDAIERSLKKGKGTEQAAAAQLAVLLGVQLGSTSFVDEICQSLIPSLSLIVGDESMSYTARAKVKNCFYIFSFSCSDVIIEDYIHFFYF